jgi:uncharacterized protein (DUF1810 family)
VMMTDTFDLNRFVQAQDPIFEQVLAELRRGRKTSHWMWFVFPQIRGLGSSPTAVRYAIGSSDEARAYLGHKILAPRLIQCSQLVLDINGSGVDDIFGYPDNLKFHSSMTLFSAVAKPDEHPDQSIFDRVLQKYFAGQHDKATLTLIQGN